MMRRLALVVALGMTPMLAAPAHAVQPSEMLADPVLEARARDISAGLRCLVCRNESIDESDASLAHDLRVLVRQRLLAGDTNQQVVKYIVARYGEFVLLKPTTTGANLILWASGPAMFLAGLGLFALTLRRRKKGDPAQAKLTAEDEARLATILKE